MRALAVASRNLVWVADHAMEWARMRRYVILGAIGLAERVGAAHREALACGGDAPAAAVAAAAGTVRFRGRVESASWEERDGFTWGETHVAGSNAATRPINDTRLSVTSTGNYGFSSNVSGSAVLGFSQTRDNTLNIVHRSVRVELRAQFTF